MGCGTDSFPQKRGEESATESDDEQVATRLRWLQTDGFVEWVIYASPFSHEILPPENNLWGLSNDVIYNGMQRSLRTWNDVEADFTFNDSPSYSWQHLFDDFDPPVTPNVDGYNLVTFSDFSITAETDGEGIVLAVTLVTYFNQDVDLEIPTTSRRLSSHLTSLMPSWISTRTILPI